MTATSSGAYYCLHRDVVTVRETGTCRDNGVLTASPQTVGLCATVLAATRTTTFLACLLATLGTARAADHLQEASKLALRVTPQRSSLVWMSTSPLPALPVSSPTSVGAALAITAASGEQATFHLPASGWQVNAAGTAYRFRGGALPGGPPSVKLATLKEGRRLKVAAKASGLSLDEPAQGTVSVQLGIGADVYCSTCTTPQQDEPGRYLARLCSAPAACPQELCGNGVVEASEVCDAPDPGVCDDVPLPVPVTCGVPGAPHECECCFVDGCLILLPDPVLDSCCGNETCIDTTHAGQVRGGVCVPPSCTSPSECAAALFDCVDGTCCTRAGELCSLPFLSRAAPG